MCINTVSNDTNHERKLPLALCLYDIKAGNEYKRGRISIIEKG